MLLDQAVAGGFQQVGNRSGLVVTVFEEEPSPREQMSGSGVHDMSNRVETIRAAGKCLARFGAQVTLSQMRVPFRDIRRIGRDEIETEIA